MKIVTVIPLKKGIFSDNLTYFSAEVIPIGSIVTIPLRNQKVLGLVINTEDASNSKIEIKEMDFNLRKILEVKEDSIFIPKYIESILATSKYFLANKSSAMASLIPALFRERYDELAVFKKSTKTVSKKNELSGAKGEKLIFQTSLPERLDAYRTLIRESFASKKSLYIVMPTETEIETFYKILGRGIEKFAFILHSGQSTKKTLETAKQILEMAHPVLIIGTAPYLSLPREDLGTIILEHENSSNYRQISSPHFDLRIFIEVFATKSNIRLILANTVLSFETLARFESGELMTLYPPSFRITGAKQLEVIKKNKEKKIDENTTERNKKFKVLGDDSIEKIKETLAQNKNVFVFSLRKGLASETVCRDCGESVNCPKCKAPVVLYLSRDKKNRIFSCNRCKVELDPDTSCANCHSWNLLPLGIGTDTVFEYLEKELGSGAEIFKLDKETALNKRGAEKIIHDFSAEAKEGIGKVLVGTEMALFYLRGKVPLSIIASFDSLWSIPNYRMSEKIVDLILSIMAKTEDMLIIETKNDTDPIIKSIQGENLLTLIREELAERKHLHYPPYQRFIKITYSGDKATSKNAKEFLEEILKDYNPEIYSGRIAKSDNKFITNALIRVSPRHWSLPEITTGGVLDPDLLNKLLPLVPTFEINIDPEDLL